MWTHAHMYAQIDTHTHMVHKVTVNNIYQTQEITLAKFFLNAVRMISVCDVWWVLSFVLRVFMSYKWTESAENTYHWACHPDVQAWCCQTSRSVDLMWQQPWLPHRRKPSLYLVLDRSKCVYAGGYTLKLIFPSNFSNLSFTFKNLCIPWSP